MYRVSRKILHPQSFLNIIFETLKIVEPFFTLIFGDQVYAQLHSFVQLFLNLMELCHNMSALPENFLFLLESLLYGPYCKV